MLPPVPTEKFESQRIHKTVDELAATIDKELNQGIGDTDIRAGMIGEIGVSPTFTEAEHNSLRAASLAQINNPHVAMNIHMPGWLRRGDEVLDIVLGEMGVSPNKSLSRTPRIRQEKTWRISGKCLIRVSG